MLIIDLVIARDLSVNFEIKYKFLMEEARKLALNEVEKYAYTNFNTIQYSVEQPHETMLDMEYGKSSISPSVDPSQYNVTPPPEQEEQYSHFNLTHNPSSAQNLSVISRPNVRNLGNVVHKEY